MTATRYLLSLAYRGTAYAGWQRQPNALSVEEVVDTALGTVLGESVKLVGCGRTDRGVHASAYYAHFDYGGTLAPGLVGRLNRMLPADIALRGICRVAPDFHARFTATGRTYDYRISLRKDPFRPETVTHLPRLADLDRERMQAAAASLLAYGEFAPFCKSNSDAFTMRCQLHHSAWTFGPERWEYRIGANRFLRGMVRLIVGMCLRVGAGKLSLEEVHTALSSQQRLPRPYSAPAAGLYLSGVTYPDSENWGWEE